MNIEEIASIINDIKAVFIVKDVIKEHHISPLVDTATGKDIGYRVEFLLSTKYDYDNEIINGWMERLGADHWYIRVRRNQLRIVFYIHEKKRKAMRRYFDDQWKQAPKELPKRDTVCVTLFKGLFRINVWNEYHKCWDDAEGDDCEMSADTELEWLAIYEED